ncbi:MAG: VOC family protein [Pseudomonadota bacterium]
MYNKNNNQAGDNSTDVLAVSRRTFISVLGAAATISLPGATSWAQAQTTSVLPLNTPGMDHLDIVVPDVEASAKFYMGVFNTTLHAQPFQGAQRYFVLLGTLNDKREVGYVAIGESRGRGSYIGHFCTSVVEFRRDSAAIFAEMGEAFDAAGFGKFPGSTGVGGIFADPDGIEIQFLPSPDTLVTAAVPSDLAPSHQGLVTPIGVDHMLLHVSDLEKAIQYYRILYGPEAGTDNNGRVTFQFADSRLILEQARYEYGFTPKIAHFAIKTEAFDKQKVASGLTALGATILPSDDEPDVLRFRDLDGIAVELRSV